MPDFFVGMIFMFEIDFIQILYTKFVLCFQGMFYNLWLTFEWHEKCLMTVFYFNVLNVLMFFTIFKFIYFLAN